MELELRSRARRRGAVPAGLTLVEALIASALFLMIVVGILPLFTRATVNTFAGRESTDVSNQARSRVEELYEMPFNSAPLTIDAGSARVVVDYLAEGETVWAADPPASGQLLWTRTTTVRQYNVAALTDGVLDTSEALDNTAGPGQIQLKEIEVLLQAGRAADAFGPQKEVTVRVLKSK